MNTTTKAANGKWTLATKTLEYRNILNTQWPREASLTRVRWDEKVYYKVDVVMNGINDVYREFKLKRDAQAYYDSLGEGV